MAYLVGIAGGGFAEIAAQNEAARIRISVSVEQIVMRLLDQPLCTKKALSNLLNRPRVNSKIFIKDEIQF